jgi:carbonic anhydrase
VQALVDGIRHFQQNDFPAKIRLFKRLAKGQQPIALLITCSDSRINPNLLTNTEPGELFILRNAGNIVPPHGLGHGGEEATIEYAILGLGIRDIIVCGHSHCGAMGALVAPEGIVESMPAVSAWLRHAESARRIVAAKYSHLQPPERAQAAVQENVLVQLDNLRTHPPVAAGLAGGDVRLHGWVYKLETGQVFAFDPERGQFAPLTGISPAPVPPPARLTAMHSI